MRLLFVKIGGLGDVIQAACALHAWKLACTNVRIEWVVGTRSADFVRKTGLAENVIEVSEDRLFSGPLYSRLAYMGKTVLDLGRRGRYDRTVIAHSDRRYRAFAALVRSGEKVSFNPSSNRPSPIAHRNRVFELWRLMTGRDEPGLDIAGSARAIGKILLDPESRTSSGLRKKRVAIAPGGASNSIRRDDYQRRWPIGNYRELAKLAIENGYEVVVLGSRNDEWTREYFENIPVIDLIGSTSIIESLHIIEGSDAFVSHDSGLLHLAVISSVPIVALFGPTPPNAIFPSARTASVVLHPGNRIACSPCYDGKNYAPCEGIPCMKQFSPTSVMDSIFLAKRGST